ncbi:Transcription factor zinc-finger [Alteromonadaceae bacterium Bs31]|nr:Transcription factor zinc-finger [Alteromonadaceae bacterium Bs31]
MQCPKCKNSALQKRVVNKIKVELDRCPSCEGLWFDKGELNLVLQSKAAKKYEIPNFAAYQKNTLCPCCKTPLHEFCYPGTLTLVDACKSCNGVWLDNREWTEIRLARAQKPWMSCPACKHLQPEEESCKQCGVVIAKYRSKQLQQASRSGESAANKTGSHTSTGYSALSNSQGRASYAEDIPGLKGSLLRFIDSAIDGLTDY